MGATERHKEIFGVPKRPEDSTYLAGFQTSGSKAVFACTHAVMSDSVTPWSVALHAPLSMGFSRQEYWEWVAILSSRGSSQPRDGTHIPSTGVWILCHWATWEVQYLHTVSKSFFFKNFRWVMVVRSVRNIWGDIYLWGDQMFCP